MLYMLLVIAHIVVPITVIIQINNSNRWINNRKNIAFKPACQAANSPSISTSFRDRSSQAEDKYNLQNCMADL